MVTPRSLALGLAPVAALGTGACATYPREAPRQVYYEVPCDLPGAFRADLRPVDPAAPFPPKAAAPPRPSSPLAARPPTPQPLCLARTDVAPTRYARRAYRYYDNYWWPYRGRSYFGFGLGLRHAGGHRFGGHHGSGHHGGGRRH